MGEMPRPGDTWDTPYGEVEVTHIDGEGVWVRTESCITSSVTQVSNWSIYADEFGGDGYRLVSRKEPIPDPRLAALEAQNAALAAEVERLRAAMRHILEYWNRSENDMAMSDALHHILDVVEAALAHRGKAEGGGR